MRSQSQFSLASYRLKLRRSQSHLTKFLDGSAVPFVSEIMPLAVGPACKDSADVLVRTGLCFGQVSLLFVPAIQCLVNFFLF